MATVAIAKQGYEYVYSNNILSLVIISLVCLAISSVAGIILLSSVNKHAPDILTYVLVGSMSALTGILVPTRFKGGDDK